MSKGDLNPTSPGITEKNEMPVHPAERSPAWGRKDIVLFYSGALSNFAPTPGLKLPFGYYGHDESGRVAVRTVEHWFQACKATNRRQFDRILGSHSSGAAKNVGRATTLRPDWEQVKFDVMLYALRAKFRLEPYRSVLLATGARTLGENSPRDFTWGIRDTQGGYAGQNLLGLALMQVRQELKMALDAVAGAGVANGRWRSDAGQQQAPERERGR